MTRRKTLQVRLVGESVNGEDIGDGRRELLITITRDMQGLDRLIRTAAWAENNGAFCELTLKH